jgi:hypothetical protein
MIDTGVAHGYFKSGAHQFARQHVGIGNRIDQYKYAQHG